ncbi:TIGR04149 family rSAM-modified RiPP [Rhizosphaericola mali]|uniref:RSAM-modified peptide n=1 Tax=Rhizosphaericola mali TaxID=2545455 RepID=A0A5P2G0I1_9BACT|nr:TIGR04149 family rSAM-modified RiPP [Rhizosphaericola mali]QES88687.1 rSAM-modified peptide [Rhizosphaericola mali]
MKKLKLTLLDLDNVEVLSRSQLRNVLGGMAPATTTEDPEDSCGVDCASNSSVCKGSCPRCNQTQVSQRYYCVQ